MKFEQQTIVDAIMAALENDQMELPPLPDMAIRVRDMIDDPNVSADQLVHALSVDPVMTVLIIRAANSAAFASGKPVDTIRGAISRIGYRMLRNLVMTVAMGKLFEAASPLINRQVKALWEHSREVAAISFVLARQHGHLNADQAMLAGLVHDIGALPLYHYADRHYPQIDQATLESLIRKSAAQIGTRLLQHWNFPAELIEVVSGHEHLQRGSAAQQPDYVDVVTVANLQMPGTAKFVAWENVAAAARLGYSPTECQNFLIDRAAHLAAVQSMLGLQPFRPEPESGAGCIEKKAPVEPAVSPVRQSVPPAGILSRLLRLFR